MGTPCGVNERLSNYRPWFVPDGPSASGEGRQQVLGEGPLRLAGVLAAVAGQAELHGEVPLLRLACQGSAATTKR